MEENSTKHASCGDETRNDNDDEEIRKLPNSIIMDEILRRLPVKSFIRFQSVSKYWLATISNDPNSAKLLSSLFRRCFFIRRLSSSPDYYYDKRCRFYLLPYEESSTEKSLEYLDYYSNVYQYDVVGSCNGLVCLYQLEKYKEYYKQQRDFYFELWNPTTRERNIIPSPPLVYVGLAYGFGYVSSLDDYKIVCSFGTIYEADEAFCGFYVFSLRSNKWEKKFCRYRYFWRYKNGKRVIKSECPFEDKKMEKIVTNLKGRGFWNEGIIYWRGDKWSPENYIYTFDLRTDEFKRYTSKNWLSKYDKISFFRLEGCLALHGNCKSNEVSEFWVLKNSDDWGSWQKMFSVGLTKIPFISISQTGKCLVQQSKEFKLYDFSEEALESIEGGRRLVKAIDHVESLVSPFRMTNSIKEKENLEIIENPMADTRLFLNKRLSAPLSCGLMNASCEKISDIEWDDGINDIGNCSEYDDEERQLMNIEDYSDYYMESYDLEDNPPLYSDLDQYWDTDISYSDGYVSYDDEGDNDIM